MSRQLRHKLKAALTAEVRGWQADQELFDSTVAEAAGMSRTDWRCLDLLGTRGAMTAGQLADAMRLTSGAVTGLIDRLEAAGQVRRVRDGGDRRRVIVELTDEVARRAAPVYGPLVRDSDAAIEAFTNEEIETILRFLRGTRAILRRHTERVEGIDVGGPAAAARVHFSSGVGSDG
jgi:DNA-binding MarR family transcriptional regulator